MTRWARGGPANKKKEHESTAWSELTIPRQKKNKSKDCTRDSRTKNHHSKSSVSVSVGVLASGKISDRTSDFDNKISVGLDTDSTSSKAVSGNVSKDSSLSRKRTFHLRDNDDKLESGLGLAAELEKIEPAKDRYPREHTCPGKATAKTKKKSKRKHLECGDSESHRLADELNRFAQSQSDLTAEQQKEISSVITKDARRENRRLERIEKKKSEQMCYNCRKPGHGMTECPEAMRDLEHGTGICFKCGSTEHTVHRCRAKLPPGVYPYAKCFICGETGHLSNKCPDNPRGLYPKGGCCNMCGSVEHYKKDCPELQKQKGFEDMKLTRLRDNGSVDDEISLHTYKHKRSKTGPKVVKF